MGNEQDADQLVTRALEFGRDDPQVNFFAALVAINLDRRENALDALERAAELGYSKFSVGSDPEFEDLRDSERYQQIMKKYDN